MISYPRFYKIFVRGMEWEIRLNYNTKNEKDDDDDDEVKICD